MVGVVLGQRRLFCIDFLNSIWYTNIVNIYKSIERMRYIMSFSYDRLWKKLIDEKMNKTDLQEAIQTTPKTIAKMGKDKNVSLETLGRICELFKCDIGEIIEYKEKKD